MKVLADIDNEVYKAIKSPLDCGGYYDSKCYDAIWNGVPIYDNATNGDVLQSILNIDEDCIWVYGIEGLVKLTVPLKWWDSPYKVESEKV